MSSGAQAGERKLSFTELYDVSLALSTGKKVIGNDFDTDHKDIVIGAGANSGGKSRFLRSLGLAQLVMQAGMFVPAESFSSEVCDGIFIFTHLKREGDLAMESGKWDEELGRMSAIVDHLKPNSVVLFNKSFSSMNPSRPARESVVCCASVSFCAKRLRRENAQSHLLASRETARSLRIDRSETLTDKLR